VTTKRKTERRRCPKCGAPELIAILYGEPTSEAWEASQRGDVVLAGCLVPCDDKGRFVGPKWHCKHCGQDCVKPMRTRAQQGALEHMLMLRRMRRGKTPFRVEERGLMGCIGISDWSPLGEFRTFAEALAAVREIKTRCARELRIIGPTGAIRYHLAQRPVGPLPSSRLPSSAAYEST
jgi:hypothetical protein